MDSRNLGSDEVEISFDELNEMLSGTDEFEIDIDEFIEENDETDQADIQSDYQYMDLSEEIERMRECLSKKEYLQAFSYAALIRKSDYSGYKDEIDECYRLCAENDVMDAVIHEAKQYIRQCAGRIVPEAFPSLKRSGLAGYIKSFRWLADCYYYGIGCEKDIEVAEHFYLEGMLFDNDEYCRTQYNLLRPEISEYGGEDELKRVMKAIAGENSNKCYARIRIAELIMEGRIREYAPSSAYVILKNQNYWSDTPQNKLGECVLYGIGCAAEPIVANCILLRAQDDLKSMIYRFVTRDAREMIEETYHDKAYYENELKNTERLIEEAQAAIVKRDEYEVFRMYGMDDENIIFYQWEETEPLCIERR